MKLSQLLTAPNQLTLLRMMFVPVLVINLVAASMAGVLIPMTLKRLRIDPALAGGVILTTVTDVVGFAALLGLGSIFLV